MVFKNEHLLALLVVLTAALVSFGCGGGNDVEPQQGSVDFDLPDEFPEEVETWVADIEDSQEEMTDWMRYNEQIYVAVARGQSPNPGHGVDINDINFSYDGEILAVEISATYTIPADDEVPSQVIAYPVGVARFDLDQLPPVELADMEFDFVIDDSEIAQHDEDIRTASLFFATDEGDMTRVYRQLETEEITLDLIAGEIMRGPTESERAVDPLPDDTQLIIRRDEEDTSVAIVDFSEEIQQVSGSLGEMLAVYSVTNTIIENFDDINSVQIKVDGEVVESLGHLDLRGPLQFDDTLLITDK